MSRLLAWYRNPIALKWSYPRKGPGRPPVSEEIVALVLRMSSENVNWGYDRLQGALANLGYSVSSSTIANILKGVEPVRCPPRAPTCNAYAERFVRSIKSECLERMILLGEHSLRGALREYSTHYLRERKHQGLDNQLLEPSNVIILPKEPIQCRERLGAC